MNSLYGRFGMNDNFTLSKILSKINYLKYETEYSEFITDVFEIGSECALHAPPSGREWEGLPLLVQSSHDDLDSLLDGVQKLIMLIAPPPL